VSAIRATRGRRADREDQQTAARRFAAGVKGQQGPGEGLLRVGGRIARAVQRPALRQRRGEGDRVGAEDRPLAAGRRHDCRPGIRGDKGNQTLVLGKAPGEVAERARREAPAGRKDRDAVSMGHAGEIAPGRLDAEMREAASGVDPHRGARGKLDRRLGGAIGAAGVPRRAVVEKLVEADNPVALTLGGHDRAAGRRRLSGRGAVRRQGRLRGGLGFRDRNVGRPGDQISRPTLRPS